MLSCRMVAGQLVGYKQISGAGGFDLKYLLSGDIHVNPVMDATHPVHATESLLPAFG